MSTLRPRDIYGGGVGRKQFILSHLNKLGYKVTGFRHPRQGELFLRYLSESTSHFSYNTILSHGNTGWVESDEPRLILEKI